MSLRDLHELPKFRDSLSYLYLEHGKIDKHESAIAFHNLEGVVPIPAASLAVLMLGPGTSITHAAVATLAENNCLAVWCGEEITRFYAFGLGGTRSSAALLFQAWLVSDPDRRLAVVRRLYQKRFPNPLGPDLALEQVRGMEGARVRATYARLAKHHGVNWTGRSYDRGNWQAADPVNRALSAANACLYGLCHAAILSVGYSPALGFLHTGKQLSFVYDIADLYKTEVTIPVAFAIAAKPPPQLEREVRIGCRDAFAQEKLLQRIIPDIREVLGEEGTEGGEWAATIDEDPAAPLELWSR